MREESMVYLECRWIDKMTIAAAAASQNVDTVATVEEEEKNDDDEEEGKADAEP